MTIAKTITYAEDSYKLWIDKAVAKLRKTYIIPYCNKHQVRFVAGNGTWYFIQADGKGFETYVTGYQLSPKMHKAMTLPIFHGRQYLGSYADDYCPDSLL